MKKKSKNPKGASGFFRQLGLRIRTLMGCPSQPKPDPDIFEKAVVSILQQNAEIYVGLYIPMHRVACGRMNDPDKVLREWAIRSQYRFSDEGYGADTDRLFAPFLSESRPGSESCGRMATFLCSCMEQAGIYRPHNGTLRLEESTARDYMEKNGVTLESDLEVTVLESAVYQNGHCLEKGFCEV